MKSILVLAVLFGLAVAQPYASFTEYGLDGCDTTANNYVEELYIYPADGACFTPSGYGELWYAYAYRVTSNTTHVLVSEYDVDDCSDIPYNYTYPIDACDDYYSDEIVASIWEEMPDDDYWEEQEIVGFGQEPWETILVTNYFDALECPEANWVTTQVQGWEECNTGVYYYCDDDEIHYDICINSDLDCSSSCTEQYEPLDNDCTASVDAPTYWNLYIDYSTSLSYQATCVGGERTSPSPCYLCILLDPLLGTLIPFFYSFPFLRGEKLVRLWGRNKLVYIP